MKTQNVVQCFMITPNSFTHFNIKSCSLEGIFYHSTLQKGSISKINKEERYSRVLRLSDTRYSAKGNKGKWR